MVVIERTPRLAEVRGPESGLLTATNDYRALPPGPLAAGPLGESSCARYTRVMELTSAAGRVDGPGALSILNDPGVRLPITVQQMVMSASGGTLELG